MTSPTAKRPPATPRALAPLSSRGRPPPRRIFYVRGRRPLTARALLCGREDYAVEASLLSDKAPEVCDGTVKGRCSGGEKGEVLTLGLLLWRSPCGGREHVDTGPPTKGGFAVGDPGPPPPFYGAPLQSLSPPPPRALSRPPE